MCRDFVEDASVYVKNYQLINVNYVNYKIKSVTIYHLLARTFAVDNFINLIKTILGYEKESS
jgi:hypothetical protein